MSLSNSYDVYCDENLGDEFQFNFNKKIDYLYLLK